MQLSRWRNLSSLKTRVIPSLTHFSEFHSTPCTCQNWKNKFNSDIKKGQPPSKSQIKFITRQKRADAKKALNSLLYNSGSSKFSFEYEGQGRHSTKGQQQKSGQRSGGKPPKKTKRKIRRESFSEDFDSHPEQIFQATYGNKSYTWSFSNWSGSSSEHSTSGFEWREHSNRTNKWKNESDVEHDDDDSCSVGSSSDRTILGLPPTGPLKIEDVKNAFRLSALKWHPDKHQGTSQAMAEEKFKLCVNAYKTLCNALSPS
ncbi:hypothetical protein PHAVU_009G147300 [Phaseolus vulgaris]|uniref:J domain-containing protein n=1 Tax=Phaseolus vulgaris TaxID=3885 RepID=V7AVL5_PHAVU|nr:hypothetical protein PHAVU_009G147300g [Phaseolus vulgaris]ESW09682.1 hypothetical protein PHAVU_009G147300g [Phaseolus vulgaris]